MIQFQTEDGVKSHDVFAKLTELNLDEFLRRKPFIKDSVKHIPSGFVTFSKNGNLDYSRILSAHGLEHALYQVLKDDPTFICLILDGEPKRAWMVNEPDTSQQTELEFEQISVGDRVVYKGKETLVYSLNEKYKTVSVLIPTAWSESSLNPISFDLSWTEPNKLRKIDKPEEAPNTSAPNPILPEHYPNAGTGKDLIAHWLDLGWENVIAANIQKYAERSVNLPREEKLKSLRKAQEYCKRLIEFVEES
jgi:hypothetical protein